MPSTSGQSWTKSVRLVIYGGVFGLIGGVALGLFIATNGSLLPTFISRSEAGSLADTLPKNPLDAFNLENLTEERSDIISGGPPKDGIPALVDPDHVSVAVADFMASDDRIVGVTVGGAARAYPIRILNYHEIINDELGGTPIAVMYCPLCDSVSVVDRRVDGEILTFGVSGLLLFSNVLIYDRTHDALWTQVGGRAISGPQAGESLTHVNSWEITSFGGWSERNPASRVVTLETGYKRNYERSPYAKYYDNDEVFFPVPEDDRLSRKKTPVIGIRIGDLATAVLVEAVKEAPNGRLEVSIGGAHVVLAADADGQEIAVVESSEGVQIVHTFWFAWAAFHPQTTLYESESTAGPGQ